MERRSAFTLLALIIVVFVLRLVVAFSIDGLTYSSYFDVRPAQTIATQGYPEWHDVYSYGGREIRFVPLYHYLVALPSFIIDVESSAKIISNLLYALIPLFVFLIARVLTQDEESSLVAAGVSAVLPILFTPNAAGPESLFFVLVLVCIYMFMRSEKPNYLYYYGLFFLLLNFTSSLAILLVVGFVVYLALTAVEGKRIKREQVDLIIFSFFFYVWLQLILYKDHFLNKGIAFVSQNVPSEALSNYFPSISITSAILLIGIVPFLAGIYVVYKSLFELKSRRLMLLISLVVSTTLLAWLKFIPFELSLSFFGLILSILFGVFYKDLVSFFRKTKISSRHLWFKIVILVILVVSMVPLSISSAVTQSIPTREERDAFEWLSHNSSPGEGVLALVEEGHLVSYVSKRSNMMDEEFLLAEDVDTRFADLQTLFTTPFQSSALELLEKYNIKYIVLTPRAKDHYEIHDLPYRTTDCFERIYKVETKIYRVTCLLRPQ